MYNDAPAPSFATDVKHALGQLAVADRTLVVATQSQALIPPAYQTCATWAHPDGSFRVVTLDGLKVRGAAHLNLIILK